jgi:erythromycin esterase-like protein
MASTNERGTRIAASRGRNPVFSARRRAWQIVIAMLHCIALSATPASAATKTQEGPAADAALARAIKHIAHPLTGAPADYDRLLRKIGNARIVLLGEDTHGTHEFYVERARITRRLIAELGFAGVVIEADWSEAAGLHAFLTETGDPADTDLALRAFDRFPRWMWRNTDFREFVTWLRQFNLQRGAGAHPVAIHGMDLYEVSPSIAAVIGYLEGTNPEAAARARDGYVCLDAGDDERQGDGAAPARWPDIDCGQPVQDQLTELASGAFLHEPDVVSIADSAYLHALQSARVVRNAEEYFRALLHQPESSWNLRDSHMASSVDLLLAHLDAVTCARSRLVIWAHNAHVGDARATARGDAGGLNLGQLLRERYPGDAISVGFTTATGVVRAATDWGGPDRSKRLRQPIPGSHAALLHATGLRRFYVILDDSQSVRATLGRARPQRGIGVRYLPALELAGHYYNARLSGQFDALVHIDRTTALQPLPRR